MLLLTILLSILLLTGCQMLPSTNIDTAFQNFTLQLFKSEVSSNTLNLHYTLQNPETYNLSDTEIRFGSFDFSPEENLAYLENLSASLEQFSSPLLSEKNQLTLDILTYYLDLSKQSVPFYYYMEPLSPITGIHAQLPVLLAEYPFYDRDDVTTYLMLLETLPAYFDSLIRFEEKKSSLGLFMANPVLDEVLAQCNSFVQMQENSFLHTSFIEKLSTLPNFTSDERIDLINKHLKLTENFVYPSYSALTKALETLRDTGANEHGLFYYPDGTAYASYLLASETGSAKSPSEIKSMMEYQIAEDYLAIAEFSETKLPDIASRTPMQILDDLRDEITGAFPRVNAGSVKIKYVPESLEDYLSPAFYFLPPIDNMMENTIYINQSHHLDAMDLFTTLAHEGYPGHLYQTTYFASTAPDPIRHLLSFKGYVEGWATYAEMCSYYISPLDKTAASYTQKNNSLILGLYAMADYGIHLEGWNLEETSSFFQSYGIENPDTIQEIYNYILGDPINYLSYYIGYLEILDLKRESPLSQIEFHEKLLQIGPAPFSIIEKWM